jgi:very-short-patch-repair endonuclease
MSDAAKQPSWHVSNKLRSRARSLRRDSTDVEQLIWNALRAHRLNGASFRRQTPVGPYVADFVCHAAMLIVELDGGQHFEPDNLRRDARRDAFLNSKGYRVLRFNNHDVMTNKEGVLETIAAALVAAPSPILPRKRERGQSGASGSGGEQE